MRYKTIVLHLLEQRPELYDRLRHERRLLAALDLYSTALKTSHETYRDRLRAKHPASDPSQIASAALEMALADLQARLPQESSDDAVDTPSPDEAMAYLRRHTPPA